MSDKNTRQAALDTFLAEKHQEGTLISHDYFWALFGKTKPRGRVDASAMQKATLDHAGDMEWLKSQLLENKHDLQNVRKEGYTLVRWVERVDRTMDDAKTELFKVIKSSTKRLESIPNVHLLNSEQQRRHDAGMLMLQHINAIRKNKNRFGEASE